MQISKMEAHFLAGGNLDRVITALITARGANIKLDFPEACAIDLAGARRFAGGADERQPEGH